MRMDQKLLYAQNETKTSSGPSGSYVDHAHNVLDLGKGAPMCVAIVLTADADAGTGDETYSVKLVTDDGTGFGSTADVSPSVSIPRTSKKGELFTVPIPPEAKVERYSRLSWTLGGTTPSISYTAWLTTYDALQTFRAYEDALTF